MKIRKPRQHQIKARQVNVKMRKPRQHQIKARQANMKICSLDNTTLGLGWQI